MPTRHTPWPPGTPCWVDYSTDDADAACAFYGGLFGWSFSDSTPEFGGYRNALLDGGMVAGIAPKMSPEQPTGWSTYLATDDADATAAAITAAGGTVVAGPMDVGPLGRMVFAVDTSGMPVGAWQSGEHTGFTIANEPGTIIWNQAASPDPVRAREFYAAVFGHRFSAMDGAPDYTTFALDGGEMIGGLGAVSSPQAPTGWQVCFAVRSADDICAAADTAGGTVLQPPMEMPYGRFAVLADPWGATFEIDQPPHLS